MADESKSVQIGRGLQTAQPVVVVGSEGGGAGSPASGSPTDAAWNGSDPSASMISILKAIYSAQMAILMEVNEIDQDMSVVRGLLEDIKTNTTPGA